MSSCPACSPGSVSLLTVRIRRSSSARQAACMAVRPYIRKISSGSLVEDLATGELCIIIASDGDARQAQERVRSPRTARPDPLQHSTEGAVMWFDVAAIPIGCATSGQRAPADRLSHGPGDRRREQQRDPLSERQRRRPADVAPDLTNAAIFPSGTLADTPHSRARQERGVCAPEDAGVDPLPDRSDRVGRVGPGRSQSPLQWLFHLRCARNVE
jgi:hypothetical protein